MSTRKLISERTGRIFHRFLADDGRPIFGTVGGGHDKPYTAEELAANARRLVACWNACAGVPTEDLERYYNAGGGIDEALEEASLRAHVKAIEQRDELLAALEQTEQWLSGWSSADPYLTVVRAAIAKAIGGKR